MLSSTNIGLELPRDIDSCVNWKTAPKGRRRAVRRTRNSVSGESNTQKAATTSSNGSDNASDEEFKEAEQVLASESEKLGVTILGRRFSDPIQSVPIKKRMRLTGSSASLPLDSSLASTPDAALASVVEGSWHGNHVDFYAISLLADTACKGDSPDDERNNFPVPEVQLPKGENGVVVTQGTSNGAIPLGSDSAPTAPTKTTEVLNDGSDESSKAEKVSRVSRLHWDLNTVMDVWDCDQQEDGDGANCEQKPADVDFNTEVCNDYNEESEKKDGSKDQEETIRNDGDVLDIAMPKENFEPLATELRKECDILNDVNPKDSIGESITPPKNNVTIIPPFGLTLAKEEIKSENEQYSNHLSTSEHEPLSTCKPAAIKQEITMAESITDKPLEVNPQLEPTAETLDVNLPSRATTGPGLILEECNKESVARVPGSKPTDARVDDNLAGISATTGDNRMEQDCMAVDPKLELGAVQSDCDQHAETGMMLTTDNDDNHTADDREKADEQVDLTVSSGVGVEVVKHGSSVVHNNSDFYPPNKSLEEDDDQYEDGELREPATQYWGANGFKEEETENGPREVDEAGNIIMEPLPDASVMGSLDAPQGEDKLLVADAGVQLDGSMDTDMIAKMDVESKDQTEQLDNDQANNLTENGSAEYIHSLKAKATGWDKQPESSRKNSESPLRQESRPGSSTLRRDLPLGIDTPRSIDDLHRTDKSFIKPRRSNEDDLDGRVDGNPRTARMNDRGGPYRHTDTSRRDEHWGETRINTGHTRHRTSEFGAPSYAPSNSGNATAASIAKVKSNGFTVAPDGTLVKVGGSCSTRKCQNSSPFYHGSPTERDQRGFRSSRERVVSPDRFGGIRGGRPGRCAAEPAREQCHRHVISPGRSRQRSFSPHRSHMRHISPSHIGSPSRSRTRSPNGWVSPTTRGRCLADHEPRYDRARSPLHRMGPGYDDRHGAPSLVHSEHHNFPTHGMRCINDRRCTSPVNLIRSPPRNARFYPEDSPPPPLHRQRDEFYHQPVHSGRGNGFNHRRGFEENRYELVRPERHFERSNNGDGFRPRNSSQKSFDSHRSGPRGLNRGIAGDLNHRSKEDRDSFRFGTGGRRNNGKYDKHEMPDRTGGDDAAARRRLS